MCVSKLCTEKKGKLSSKITFASIYTVYHTNQSITMLYVLNVTARCEKSKDCQTLGKKVCHLSYLQEPYKQYFNIKLFPNV